MESLQAHFTDEPIRYWRDKKGREVDFVLARRPDEVDAIECKWNADAFDAAGLGAFRGYYPIGRNYLVTPAGEPAYTKRYGNMEVRVCTPSDLHP